MVPKRLCKSQLSKFRFFLKRHTSSTTFTRLDPLLFAAEKKNSLSLFHVFAIKLLSSSSLCKGEQQQHKEMIREEETTFSAKL